MSFTCKSMILDIADAYNTSNFMALMFLNMKFESSLISISSADIQSTYGPDITGYEIDRIFDTSYAQTGPLSNGWLNNTSSTNIRIICVFTAEETFDEIVIGNGHNSGNATTYGIKNVKITISDDVITDTTYNAAVSNSFVVFDGIFAEHSNVDEADPQILTLEEPPAPPQGIQSIRISTDYVYNNTILGQISEGISRAIPYPHGFGIQGNKFFTVVLGYSEIFKIFTGIGLNELSSNIISVADLNKAFILNTGLGTNAYPNSLVGLGIENFHQVFTPIGISNILTNLISFGLYIESISFSLNSVQGRLEDVTSENIVALHNSIMLRDPNQSNQAILHRIIDGIQSAFSVLGLVAEGHNGVEALKVTISGEDFRRIQALQTRILGPNIVEGFQYIIQSLKDLEAASYQVPTAIYLDGVKVDTAIGSNTVEITFDQSNIHNEISISSISQELFEWGDPSVDAGIPRIEAHIGNRVLFFLLEERDGSANNFTLWGRDQTARDNSPWAETTSVSLEERQLASDVVSGVTGYSAVDWDIYDWMLPIGFEAEGTPVDIISAVVSEIGGVVRAQDDGSLLVRKALPVRPVDMTTATPVVTYLADSIVNFSHEKTTGDHYNVVQVQTYSSDVGSLDIELEDSSLSPGETAIIKVYDTLNAPEVLSTYATNGNISGSVGSFVEEHTELIEFEEGVGETSYPIKSIVDIEWIGASGTLSDLEQYGKTLTLTDLEAFRLANVTYKTSYKRYQVTDSNVEAVLAVFFFDEEQNTDVIVKTQAIAQNISGEFIDKEGPVISAENLTDKAGAVLRGEAWIDQNKYDSYRHQFTSPHNDLLTDGAVIWLDCNRVGTSGNYYVRSYSVTISGPKVYDTIEAIQWQI